MLIKPKHSYSLISKKSEFLAQIIKTHLIKLNSEAGVYLGKSLLGTSLSFSDTDVPTKKLVVISNVERPNFDKIDLDADPVPYLFELLNVENTECKRFIRTKIASNKSIKPELLYYYMIVLSDAVQGDEFNVTKADYILNHYQYKSHYTSMDRYRAFYTYIQSPTEQKLFHLIDVFKEASDPMKTLVYITTQFNDRSVPEATVARIGITYNESSFIRNLLSFSIALLNSEDIEQFIIYMISKTVE